MRINFFHTNGLTSQRLEELKIGPLLFREEAIFRREIKLEDQVVIRVELLKATQDYARWSIRHHFVKADGTLSAILNLDGAWIDIEKRKLTVPDHSIKEVFDKFPKSSEFEWVEAKPKS